MQDIADAPPEANSLEKVDVAVTQAVAPLRDTLPVRILGALSELADQPPLIALSAGTMVVGLWRGDRRLAETGGRMLASHLLATAIKSAIKARVVRTRPHLLVDDDDYRMHAGEEKEPTVSSFPSGHTAGAVAVAQAVVRGHPDRRPAAYTLAGSAALMQIPRCAHYPSDVGAGIAIGVAAEALVYGAELLVTASLNRQRHRKTA
ncbi:phosphatase PAP2 family protein [Sphingomonas solaris]|uniref:Phosphatase PAP2 family protein n=1 Tax=Alterirhizorhabdus solaris TaxID=2529389 RepID=A0A558R325_9SPHN|nr:phosphatase PAP2 family protein [Sphingomonas solaris]TVV73783.1 phosphatase PAP2 family protein [Sphingomonas solaris]